MLTINTKQATKEITSFIRQTIQNAGFDNIVVGLSGGIDSATSLHLLCQSSVKNVYVVHLYYFDPKPEVDIILSSLSIPKENVFSISIKEPVDTIKKELSITDQLRLGNIMARMRMIYLYDFAKKNNALVCGTENRTEHYLGYFTRYGDEASDFEPLRSLYKTQVKQLATYLTIPEQIIKQAPTAGLWEGQTDEEELGFTYEEADNVLHCYFDEKKNEAQIKSLGYKNVHSVLQRVKQNDFKHHLPHVMK